MISSKCQDCDCENFGHTFQDCIKNLTIKVKAYTKHIDEMQNINEHLSRWNEELRKYLRYKDLEIKKLKEAGLKAANLVSPDEPPKQPAPPTFEYRVASITNDSSDGTIMSFINDIGGNGWELVTALMNGRVTEYYFKRVRNKAEVANNG